MSESLEEIAERLELSCTHPEAADVRYLLGDETFVKLTPEKIGLVALVDKYVIPYLGVQDCWGNSNYRQVKELGRVMKDYANGNDRRFNECVRLARVAEKLEVIRESEHFSSDVFVDWVTLYQKIEGTFLIPQRSLSDFVDISMEDFGKLRHLSLDYSDGPSLSETSRNMRNHWKDLIKLPSATINKMWGLKEYGSEKFGRLMFSSIAPYVERKNDHFLQYMDLLTNLKEDTGFREGWKETSREFLFRHKERSEDFFLLPVYVHKKLIDLYVFSRENRLLGEFHSGVNITLQKGTTNKWAQHIIDNLNRGAIGGDTYRIA